jgi:hypothetical protein
VPEPSYDDYFGAQSTWTNAGDFAIESRTPVAIDRENKTRSPTGSSVLDADSVYDDSGRFFHGYKEGKYFLPNDGVSQVNPEARENPSECRHNQVLQAEQDRLDVQHALSVMLMGGDLYWAPIEHPNAVLDIATGTGIWAIEFGEHHPCLAAPKDDILMGDSPSTPGGKSCRDGLELHSTDITTSELHVCQRRLGGRVGLWLLR